MKKQTFAILLALALLLAALAGCGQDNGGSSKSSDKDEEEEQLLEKGWYRVFDGDEELAGYLEVKSSKIVVYDEAANEEDTLRYEYDAKKDLYTIEDGELFGDGEFTVKKSKKQLTLTADGDKYTLEEIDEEDMPRPGTAKTPGFDDPVDDEIGTAKTPGFDDPVEGVELPLGCYAAYNGSTHMGYLKVTDRTLTFYEADGYQDDELRYSYDRDGQCVATDEDGNVIVMIQFTYERGSYYMSGGATAGYLLEPVRESEIPVYRNNSGTSAPAYGTGVALPATDSDLDF